MTLTEKERRALQGPVRKERDVRIVKRAQALLWLSAGEQVQEVAGPLQVTRQTIRNWVKQYQERKGAPVRERPADKPHLGRRAKKREVGRACAYIMALSPQERLRRAGVLGNRFWLQKAFQEDGK